MTLYRVKVILLSYTTVQFCCLYSCLEHHQKADTRSLIMTDTKELIIRNLYRGEKITDSLLKCIVIADTNVAYTVTVILLPPYPPPLGDLTF